MTEYDKLFDDGFDKFLKNCEITKLKKYCNIDRNFCISYKVLHRQFRCFFIIATESITDSSIYAERIYSNFKYELERHYTKQDYKLLEELDYFTAESLKDAVRERESAGYFAKNFHGERIEKH